MMSCAVTTPLSAAEIALGRDADESPVFHYHQMADPLPLHPGPGDACCLLGFNGYDPAAHDLAKPHEAALSPLLPARVVPSSYLSLSVSAIVTANNARRA